MDVSKKISLGVSPNASARTPPRAAAVIKTVASLDRIEDQLGALQERIATLAASMEAGDTTPYRHALPGGGVPYRLRRTIQQTGV